ncbi:hypothetical protein [Pueribacillus theae]|nr:hypothetical protein [Pueribacillus theae]
MLDYIQKIKLADFLKEHLTIAKQGGKYPLHLATLAVIIGRLL